MKKYVFLISILLSACGGGGSSNDEGVGEENQRGVYFSFDGTGSSIIDSSGNGYDSKATGISRVDGKVGDAVQFLTEGSVIELLPEASPVTEMLSLTVWIKTDMEFTDRQQIIGGWTGGKPGSFYPINNFGISFINNRLSFEVSVYPGVLSVESDVLPIAFDEWFHIAVTYDGSQVKFYYNGSLINEESVISDFDMIVGNQIGHNYHVFGGITIVDQFYGYIDELYLIEDLITDQEILDYYNSTM